MNQRQEQTKDTVKLNKTKNGAGLNRDTQGTKTKQKNTGGET